MLRPALTLLLLFTLLTGVAYPALLTGLGQVLFPKQANGSLLTFDERVVGSSLIGQAFGQPKYFWSRPSATGAFAYDASASSGSNLGPTNPALREAIQGRMSRVLAGNSEGQARPPVDLVTASASGLDPHISPAAALFQIPRVASARDMAPGRLRALVEAHTEGRTLGLFGEPRVNVLELNLELDRKLDR